MKPSYHHVRDQINNKNITHVQLVVVRVRDNSGGDGSGGDSGGENGGENGGGEGE